MKRTYSFILLMYVVKLLNAQTVEQESLEWKKLRLQPAVTVSFPMAVDNRNPVLPMGLNLDAYYELNKVADFRAGIDLGTFNGLTVGATYHLVDKDVTKSTRFIVANTGKMIYFYKNTSQFRSVFGPTARLQIGNYTPTGFYARFDGGIDFQTYSRAYYKGYRSSRNGFGSAKLTACVVKLNQPEETNSGRILQSRVGVGAAAGYLYEYKPWKRITVFGGADMGYVKILGVADYVTQYYTIENNDWMIIGTMKAGISVSL